MGAFGASFFPLGHAAMPTTEPKVKIASYKQYVSTYLTQSNRIQLKHCSIEITYDVRRNLFTKDRVSRNHSITVLGEYESKMLNKLNSSFKIYIS